MKRVLILVLLIATILLCACGNQNDKVVNNSNPTNTEEAMVQTETIKEEVPQETKVIFDDNVITAELLGFENHPELEMFLLSLQVTNKTDRKIWVYLDEASVNNEMMQLVMSGVPLNILPQKTGSNSFIFYFKQISINSFDEVNTYFFIFTLIYSTNYARKSATE